MLTKRTARFFRDRAARLGVSLFDATCGCGCAPPTQGASATRTPVLDSRPRRFRSVVSSPTGGDSMKRIAVASVAVALCATPALAQERDANSSLFLEGGGPGLLYSVNYELLFGDDFGIRAGFSYQSLSASGSSGSGSAPVSIITIPILANELVSFGSSALELGGGATIIQAAGAASGNGLAVSASGTTVLGTAILGYRRQPVDGGFQFRIGIEALAGKGLALRNPDPNKLGVLPWLYVSIGYSM